MDFICLTDDPHLRSDTWRLEHIVPALSEDPIRSARQLKIMGHPVLSAYDESIWVDARVVLKVDPDLIFDEWLAAADIAVPLHSYRDSVVSEFAEILRVGLDDSHRVYEQLNHYAVGGLDRLNGPVPWTGIMARRRGPVVDAVMAEWMQHVWRYSRRDQLSFMEASARCGLTPDLVEMDNHESDVHTWHLHQGRPTRSFALRSALPFLAPVAEVGVLRGELQRAEAQVEAVGARHRSELEREYARAIKAEQRLKRVEEDLRLALVTQRRLLDELERVVAERHHWWRRLLRRPSGTKGSDDR
ncbi:glycosyltransferase domain-containing protein [Nocardioides baekrokdamisoli]|uniref:glycosyltransferase domain-containing protein n=1 Tax=Nocardioides baekrokdamisoli TaxID=1804624 RepID=UPI0013DD8899|nr:glycosyltransferase domain-containing protein [Nocardioides baekrokdamisoli]